MRKIAVVTGGNRGIGAGIVECLAEKGYDIFFTYNSAKAEAEELSRRIADQYKCACRYMQADFSKRGVAEDVIASAIEEMGGLDVLVNNAANTLPTGSILNFPVEVMDTMIEVNYRSPIMATRKAAQYMVKNGIKGNIVSISSVRATQAFPRDGVYGSIKAAIIRSTKSFAIDLGPFGVRVNCVAPGCIRIRDLDLPDEQCAEASVAPKIPLLRLGMPKDIGHAVAWLVSDDAAYITGQTLLVDGGFTLPGTAHGDDSIPCNAFGFYTEEKYHEICD